MSAHRSSTLVLVLFGLGGTVGASQLMHDRSSDASREPRNAARSELRVIGQAPSTSTHTGAETPRAAAPARPGASPYEITFLSDGGASLPRRAAAHEALSDPVHVRRATTAPTKPATGGATIRAVSVSAAGAAKPTPTPASKPSEPASHLARMARMIRSMPLTLERSGSESDSAAGPAPTTAQRDAPPAASAPSRAAAPNVSDSRSPRPQVGDRWRRLTAAAPTAPQRAVDASRATPARVASVAPTAVAKTPAESKISTPPPAHAPKTEAQVARSTANRVAPANPAASRSGVATASDLDDREAPKFSVRELLPRFGTFRNGNSARPGAPRATEARVAKDAPPARSTVERIADAAPEARESVVLTLNESKEAQRAFTAGSSIQSVAPTASVEGAAPGATPYPQRAKIVYRPAVASVNRYGQPVLSPNVTLAGSQIPADGDVQYYSDSTENLPPPDAEVVVPEDWSAPMVEGPYYQGAECYGQPAPRLGPMQEMICHIRACLNGPRAPEPGVGTERVVHAISFIDTTQPLNNFSLRVDAGYNYMAPDRSEYFWAKIGGRGPALAETSVDYRQLRAYLEMGGEKFSVGTTFPIQIVDPDINWDSAGYGDMTITTKAVFLDGWTWQLTNLFRVYIPSGDPSAGLGTGHASIEPGFAWRYKWSDVTYFHGDLKFWIPLGGDPVASGEVLSYGAAISHVWRETDCFAIMPTFEVVGFSFLDGELTLPPPPLIPVDDREEVDSDGILNIHPGVRFVWDKGSDCGVQELGLFTGFSLTSDHLYSEILRAELRWSW